MVKGLVTVFAGGPGGKSVIAYKADSGEPAWTADGLISTAPQLSKVNGVDVLLIDDKGVCSSRKLVSRLEHDWSKEGMPRCRSLSSWFDDLLIARSTKGCDEFTFQHRRPVR